MSNVHLRELPPATLQVLKDTALAQGRSLNAELVRLLNAEAERIIRTRDFLTHVQPKKPRKPVDLERLIQEDRQARTEPKL